VATQLFFCKIEQTLIFLSGEELHGYTMREIAAYAGVHYSLVSKAIKAWEERDSTFKT